MQKQPNILSVPLWDGNQLQALETPALGDPAKVGQPSERPTLVIVPSPQLPWTAWAGSIAYLRQHYRIFTWKLRGLYDDEGGPPLSPREHAKDLESLLEAAEVDQIRLASWGLGAAIGLEYHRTGKRSVRSAAFVAPELGEGMAAGLGFGAPAGKWFLLKWRAASKLCRLPQLGKTGDGGSTGLSARFLRVFGLASDTLVDEQFAAALEELALADHRRYLRTLKLFLSYPHGPSPETFAFPTKWIMGDLMGKGPLRDARQFMRSSSLAELEVVDAGSALLPFEYPEHLQLSLESFFLGSDARAKRQENQADES